MREFRQIACSSCHTKNQFVVAVDITSDPPEWIVSCNACDDGKGSFSSLTEAVDMLKKSLDETTKH